MDKHGKNNAWTWFTPVVLGLAALQFLVFFMAPQWKAAQTGITVALAVVAFAYLVLRDKK